ncbi:MAG: HAMP domain-containing sensor histidine kinase [bacterium]|nr:HAMP domain-containing sensor histidine kinase [bacterium]
MTDRQSDAELVSVVAHDLKTPVSAAKGFIDLVQQAGPLNERQQYYAEKALAALGRMEQLISDLLDYARLEGGVGLKLVECNLSGLIQDAVGLMEELAAARGIRLHVEGIEQKVRVRGDARLLSQVVHNLLSNAIKYNRDGGDVWIVVHVYRDQLRVDIRDSGIGIPEKDLERVFGRFYRSKLGIEAKIEGTGLGLAITRTIVEMHGGQIWVESVVGEGSTFTFTLPLPRQRSRRKDAPSTSESASEESDMVADQAQDSHDSAESESRSDRL